MGVIGELTFTHVKEDFNCILTFSPIKRIRGKLYIEYSVFVASLWGHGGIYEIKKIKEKWQIVNTVTFWVS